MQRLFCLLLLFFVRPVVYAQATGDDDSLLNAPGIELVNDSLWGHQLRLESCGAEHLRLFVDSQLVDVVLFPQVKPVKANVLLVRDGDSVYHTNFCALSDTVLIFGFAHQGFVFASSIVWHIRDGHIDRSCMMNNGYNANPAFIYINKQKQYQYDYYLKFQYDKADKVAKKNPYRFIGRSDLATIKGTSRKMYKSKVPLKDPGDGADEEVSKAYYRYVERHFND